MAGTTPHGRRVAVTGLGLVTPLGDTPDAFFDALMAGRSAIGRRTVGEAPHETALLSAACDGFDPAPWLDRARLMTMDRHAQLAAVAGLAAWLAAGLEGTLSDARRERAAVLWGSGAAGANAAERGYRDLFVRGRPRVSPLSVVLGMHNAAASQLALLLRLGGSCTTYAVACASSAVAIGEALHKLRSGACDLVLAGGSEAALPFGMVKAWQSLQVLAELAGYGASADHHHLTTPDAAGQASALRAALADAGAAADEVGYVNAHGTATVDGDPVEIAALREVLGSAAPRVAVSSTKSMHGHPMGAAGALEAAATVLALRQQAVPPTATLTELDPACGGVEHVRGVGRDGLDLRLALSSSFAFGGSNAVLAFRRAG